MKQIANSCSRHRLLTSGALLALASSLPAPAFADPDPTPDIEASGAQVIATAQNKSWSPVRAIATNLLIEATGPIDGSSIAVTDNAVSATAKANSANAALTPDARDLEAATEGTSIETGMDGTNAQSAALVAIRQATDGALVSATTSGSRIRARLGDLVDGSAALSANTQEAVALANDAAETLSLTGVAVGTGAGIVSDQSVGGDAAVMARFSGTAALKVVDAPRSDLEVSQNLQRAVAYGNSGSNALGVDAVQLDAAASYGVPSVVGANASDPSVNAAYAVLADQRLASGVSAGAHGGFTVKVDDTAFASNVTDEGNSLVAAAYGNQSSNGLDLSADAIANNAWDGGAVATVTNVQSAAGVPVKATSNGGAQIAIDGDAVEASLAARDNAVLAVATANRADGNLLSVTANTVDAGEGFGGGEGGGGFPPIGTALVDGDYTMTVTAPFSVQNDQLTKAGVTARASDAATMMTVDADIIRSNATISGNSAGAQASGNAATNGLSLDANSLATAADLNSLQLGQGEVAASVGSATDRAGAILSAAGDVVDTSLAVFDNSLEASAVENKVTNSMTITANSLVNASGHENAQAGMLDYGVGAAADYALANSQEISGSYQLPVAVKASAYGAFDTAAGDGAVRSALKVTGNSQTASALGNGAANSFVIAATVLDEDEDLAPGTALSSTQAAYTSVEAVSDMHLGVTTEAVDSSLLLSGNSNVAQARMNNATNSLTVDAVSAGSVSGAPATVLADAGYALSVMGDHVLASNQVAEGNVSATAVTTGQSVNPAMSFVRSSFGASDNETLAEAAANTAGNSLSLTSAVQGEASAGLLNRQSNYASVDAQATSAYGIGAHASSDASSLVDGNVTSSMARGNMAANMLAVSGVVEDGCTPDLASITTGALNSAKAPAVLSNVQMNAGGVSAYAAAPTVSVSYGSVGVSDSRLGVTGNSVSAAAYGNSATNMVTLASLGSLPASGVSNVQTNSGTVTAQVTNAAYTITSPGLSTSRIDLSGNSISASAIGNAATSKVTVSR